MNNLKTVIVGCITVKLLPVTHGIGDLLISSSIKNSLSKVSTFVK